MIKTTGTQALFILGEEIHCGGKLCCTVLKKVIENTVERDLLKEKGRALVVLFLVLSRYFKLSWSQYASVVSPKWVETELPAISKT